MEFNLNSGFNIDLTNYYWFQEGFSEEELVWVDNLKNLYPYTSFISIPINKSDEDLGPTSLDEQKVVTSKFRSIFYKNENYFDENSTWLYEKLKKFAIDANNILWNFELGSYIDPIQYIEYSENGSHEWKTDIDAINNYKKVTFIVELSDPSEYEGGDIEIWSCGSFKTLPKVKGCVIIFPSYLLYRMTPITKGNKNIIKFWIGGRSFR